MHQGFPAVAISLVLGVNRSGYQQTLNRPAARHPTPEQPSREYLRVVDDQNIATPQVFGKI